MIIEALKKIQRRSFPFLIIFILSGLGFNQVFAYQPTDSIKVITGGIKLEANASAYIITNVPSTVAKTTPGMGASIGGFVFFDIHRHVALQIEVLYHFRQNSVLQQGNQGTLLYLGVEVPFYVMGQWCFGNGSRLFVGTGPNADFGYYAVIKSKNEKFDLYQKDNETELSAMQNTSMGWAVMIGYEFCFGLQLNLAYKGGFYNVLDDHRTHIGSYPYSLSAGVAYRFGLWTPKRKAGNVD